MSVETRHIGLTLKAHATVTDEADMSSWMTSDGRPQRVFRPDTIELTVERDENGERLSRCITVRGFQLNKDGSPGKRRTQAGLDGTWMSPPAPEWAVQWVADLEHIGGEA